MDQDPLKDYRLEPTIRERICKKLFRIIYSVYRPKLGGHRIQVNRPFKVLYANGTLSEYEYVYGQSQSDNPTELGLFEGRTRDRWYRRYYDDKALYPNGKHLPIIYLD